MLVIAYQTSTSKYRIETVELISGNCLLAREFHEYWSREDPWIASLTGLR